MIFFILFRPLLNSPYICGPLTISSPFIISAFYAEKPCIRFSSLISLPLAAWIFGIFDYFFDYCFMTHGVKIWSDKLC